MFSAIARCAAPGQHRNCWLCFPPPMTIRRGQSCGASNPGNQEPRNPFEKLPLQVQRQYSRDLLHHVQRAVFSHLGVDPVDARHLPQYQPKNQVELHVHHHHHLYVDTPQNTQQPSSPQIGANNDRSIARSPPSKSMWKDYDEMANKTLLDILWSKNHPFYSSNITKKDTEPPKKHREETTFRHSHPTFETAATTTGFCKIEKPGENGEVLPTTVSNKGLNFPVKSTWKEFSPPNKPAKRSSSAHVGTQRKHSSMSQPTTKSITKSKIRSLEEAAQERIKKLSDLGSLINSAETGFREDSRPKDSGVSRHEKREAAIQTHIDSSIMYGHQSRPKNETFQEESEAAQESFLAAAKAAKDRLRNLVNECANANARPYGVEDPQLLAADIRRQKELQALEKIQSCIHDQEIAAQKNRTAKSPAWPPPVSATSPYIFSARPPSRESNNSEVPSSRPTVRSSSPCSDISSLSRASIALSDIPPSVQNARPPSQVSNTSNVPYAVNLAPGQHTWLPPSQASMPNYAHQVKPYAPPDEVVERLQDASFQENNQAMEEILRKRPRPTRFGRKPRQPPFEDTKQLDAETPRELSVEDKVLPNQEQQQQQIGKLGSDLEVVRISSPMEYMRLFQEQQSRPKIKVVDGSDAKEKAQDTWAKVESELAKLVSGLALNNIEDALLNLERKLTNVESLRYQVVEAFKVRDEGHNNIMESDADQWKTDVPEGYTLYNSPAYETRAADLDTQEVISSPRQAEVVAEKANETENQTEIELECLKDENKKLRMELQQLQARNNSQMEMPFATQGKTHMEIEALREMNKRLKLELQQIREDTEIENNGCRAKFAIQEAEFEKLQEVNSRLQSELERVLGKQMNDLDKQDLLQKLSAVVRESESLKCSLEVTRRELSDEDRKNDLLKQWLGDEDLHKREHVILNSAQELNSELINNLSRMEDTLTDFGTSTKSLLPFLEEHVAITKSLAEVFEKKAPCRPEIQETTTMQASEITEKIEELKKAAEAKRHQINELVNINEELLQFAQMKEDELARLNEEAAQLQDETGQQEMHEESNPQLLLMREIEETKKQSKEMVEIMDSLEYHYSILKAKFTQLENEMAQRDETVERLSSHLAARIEGEEHVLEEAKQLQNSLKNAQYNEYEMKNQAERLAKMKQELEEKLHGLEREISMSHAHIEELKSQNTVIKDLMESKEKEAEAMRQETGDIKWRVMQLEEELMEKEGQIAILKGNFLDDSD